MTSLRHPTLAILIALVSTAALGPGIFLGDDSTALGRQAARIALHEGTTLTDLQELMRLAPAERLNGVLVPLLLDELPDTTQFHAVDFGQAVGGNAFVVVGGSAGFPGVAGRESAGAGYGYVAGAGYGSASSAGGAPSSRQHAQFAGDNGLLDSTGGRSSGFLAAPATEDSSAIAPEDIALVDRNVEQLPLLALKPANVDTGSQASADAAVNAVPEPATGLLLGLGLLGLLGARRSRRTPSGTASFS
nr:PEP-CTERM sorting domain-containing protein [uncultured Noviherbaspirillum sp.]